MNLSQRYEVTDAQIVVIFKFSHDLVFLITVFYLVGGSLPRKSITFDFLMNISTLYCYDILYKTAAAVFWCVNIMA